MPVSPSSCSISSPSASPPASGPCGTLAVSSGSSASCGPTAPSSTSPSASPPSRGSCCSSLAVSSCPTPVENSRAAALLGAHAFSSPAVAPARLPSAELASTTGDYSLASAAVVGDGLVAETRSAAATENEHGAEQKEHGAHDTGAEKVLDFRHGRCNSRFTLVTDLATERLAQVAARSVE